MKNQNESGLLVLCCLANAPLRLYVKQARQKHKRYDSLRPGPDLVVLSREIRPQTSVHFG